MKYEDYYEDRMLATEEAFARLLEIEKNNHKGITTNDSVFYIETDWKNDIDNVKKFWGNY